MSMIAILLASSLVTVIAVIGLADGVTHLLCWMARSMTAPHVLRTTGSPSDMTGRDRLAA